MNFSLLLINVFHTIFILILELTFNVSANDYNVLIDDRKSKLSQVGCARVGKFSYERVRFKRFGLDELYILVREGTGTDLF